MTFRKTTDSKSKETEWAATTPLELVRKFGPDCDSGDSGPSFLSNHERVEAPFVSLRVQRRHLRADKPYLVVGVLTL